ADARSPARRREWIPPERARRPRLPWPLAAPCRNRAAVRAGGERPPRRPAGSRARDARRRALLPDAARALWRLATHAGGVQRRRGAGRPGARGPPRGPPLGPGQGSPAPPRAPRLRLALPRRGPYRRAAAYLLGSSRVAQRVRRTA